MKCPVKGCKGDRFYLVPNPKQARDQPLYFFHCFYHDVRAVDISEQEYAERFPHLYGIQKANGVWNKNKRKNGRTLEDFL